MLEAEPKLVRSTDGTMIAVRVFGEGDGIPILLANAVGANLSIWWHVLEDLTQERRVITWDHRGMFESGPPATDRLDATAHTQDALAAIRSLKIERFHLLGWSSGGRIALQIAQEHPERVASLSLVCAGYGHALSALFRLELNALLPRFANIAKYIAGPLHAALRNFVARPEVAGLVRQSGAIGATADTQAFVGYLKGLADANPRRLLASYHAVSGDPAADLLSEIISPTLVIAGEHDQFTSRAVTTEILAKIPDAKLEIYEDATHYLPIEHPSKLAYDLAKFHKEIENSLK